MTYVNMSIQELIPQGLGSRENVVWVQMLSNMGKPFGLPADRDGYESSLHVQVHIFCAKKYIPIASEQAMDALRIKLTNSRRDFLCLGFGMMLTIMIPSSRPAHPNPAKYTKNSFISGMAVSRNIDINPLL